MVIENFCNCYANFICFVREVEVQIRWGIEDNSEVPYFFFYKTESFSFQNNPKNLGLYNKMDLDLWDCLGTGIIAKLLWYFL